MCVRTFVFAIIRRINLQLQFSNVRRISEAGEKGVGSSVLQHNTILKTDFHHAKANFYLMFVVFHCSLSLVFIFFSFRQCEFVLLLVHVHLRSVIEMYALLKEVQLKNQMSQST